MPVNKNPLLACRQLRSNSRACVGAALGCSLIERGTRMVGKLKTTLAVPTPPRGSDRD
jgi:hypothetical protein